MVSQEDVDYFDKLQDDFDENRDYRARTISTQNNINAKLIEQK